MKEDTASKLLLEMLRDKMDAELHELLESSKTSKLTIRIKGDQMSIEGDAGTDCKNAFICAMAYASIIEAICEKYKADHKGTKPEELDLFHELTKTAYIQVLTSFVELCKIGPSVEISEVNDEEDDDDEAD